MGQDLIDMRGFVCHAGQAENRFLPQILISDFGDGHIELIPQSTLQALQDLPLVFQ